MTSADCTLFETKIFPQLFGDIPPGDGYCCSRPSVKCNPQNRITSISIGKNESANGFLPPQLAQLDKLTIIQLFQNNLTGSIPPELGSMTQLTDLSLGGNRLTGTIPPELGNLVNLTFLYVNINNLKGTIPAELGKLTNLKALHLNDNPLLVGPIPASLTALPLIQELIYDDKNAPINSTATTTPFANNLNSNPPIWLLISVLIITVILVLSSFIIYRRFAQKRNSKELQLLQNSVARDSTCANMETQRQPAIVTYESSNTGSRTSYNPLLQFAPPNQPLASPYQNQTAQYQNGPVQYQKRPNPYQQQSFPSYPNNSTTTSGSGDLGIVIGNIPPPPLGITSMVEESVLFDSRLVIRKKMAGSGGCGQVYKAKYANKDAVAKIPILEAHEQLIYDESQVMRKLSSPWTVNVLHFMSNASLPIPGQTYVPQTALLIEFMNLGTLSQHLRNTIAPSKQADQQLVLNQTLSISIMAVKGIQFIHEQGYNHLDVKPENILVHRNPNNSITAKISDFGSTRTEGSYDSVFQTPGYIPPEGIVQSNQMILPQKTFKYDIYAFGCSLIHIILLENYPAMWSGVNKTIAQKREFLTNSIPNTQLIDLIISCMDDNPYIRPTAALIASALEGFNQLDFSSKKLPQNMNQSILFTAGALKPGEKRGASSLKYESTSDIYKYTAGKFVMVEIGLDQTATWPEFLTAFCGSFGIEQGFNAALFKSKVNPVANRVTVNVLDKGVFKDVQPLLLDSTDDMKQLWIEDLYTFIEDLKIELS